MPLTILITAMDTGGMERFAANLCNTLLSENRAVRLIALNDAKNPGSVQWLEDRVPFQVLHRRARWAAPKLTNRCREHPGEPVLVLSLEIAVVLGHLKRLGLIRNPLFYRESTDVRSHLNPPWTGRLTRLLPRLDGLFVQSRTVEADIVSLGVPLPPVTCIPNPCPALTLPSPGFSVPNASSPRLLCVARLEKIKGQERLLNALPGILQVFPSATLTLLGDGSMRKQLEQNAHDLGISEHVDFAGFQENPAPFYEQADVVMVPSDYEGFPNVIPEALAHGCRLLCADAPGGIREILESAGLGTFLIPLFDFSGTLPSALRDCLAAPSSLWESARSRMAEACAPEAVANAVWDLLMG